MKFMYATYIPHHIHLDMEMDGLEMTSNFLKYNIKYKESFKCDFKEYGIER